MSGICGMCARRECIGRDDDRYQCDKYLGYESFDDSHEKLEADVRQRLIRPSTQIDCTYDDVMRWLDRQAAITERKSVRHQESLAQRMIRDGYEYEIWELKKRIKELTAERDELNATLDSGTCENIAPNYLDFLCSKCGFVHYHSDENDMGDGNDWNCCPNCGCKVVS